jgi:hypothetical protein
VDICSKAKITIWTKNHAGWFPFDRVKRGND